MNNTKSSVRPEFWNTREDFSHYMNASSEFDKIIREASEKLTPDENRLLYLIMTGEPIDPTVIAKDGLKIWCKTCCKDYNADFHYRKKYGLSTAQVIQMHEERDYKCDICNGNQPPRKVGRTKYKSDTMAIDHCHKSGKIRGLLCHVCNTFLGAVKDDTRILKKMISYLERNN